MRIRRCQLHTLSGRAVVTMPVTDVSERNLSRRRIPRLAGEVTLSQEPPVTLDEAVFQPTVRKGRGNSEVPHTSQACLAFGAASHLNRMPVLREGRVQLDA